MAPGRGLGFLVLTAMLKTYVVSEKPPNILFILADDMGQWAMGAYGNKEIITPNLDKLASEGKRFTNAYCNTPVCSASRASYFTGRLPSQHGVHDWIAGGNGCDGHGINYTQNEMFYTDVLTKHGYTCGISGKYHLGDQPHAQHSFSHWFVHQSGGGNYNNPPLVKDGKCVNVEGYISDIITDDAISFIENHTTSGTEDPFYLSVHFTAPHSPYYGQDGMAKSMHPPEVVAMYDNCSFHSLPQEKENSYAPHTGGLTRACLANRQCLLGYFAAVTAMDTDIGRLMDTLQKHNLDNDTLVVFASDHGFNAGQHGLWGKGNAVYPTNLFQTSMKVPMIFRHKGVIQPSVDNSVVQVVDVGPTLLEYAGNLSYPQTSNVAGKSFLPALQGHPQTFRKPSQSFVFAEYGQTRGGIFQQEFKVISRLVGNREVYDLNSDAEEKENLMFLGPLPQSVLTMYEYGVEQMRWWFSYFEDPYASGWTLPVTGRGQLHEVLFKAAGETTTPPFNALYAPHNEKTLQCSESKSRCAMEDGDHELDWWDFD